MTNPFMYPVDEYKRDLNLRKGTVEQIAKYTALKLNKPYEEILPLVIKEMKTNEDIKIVDRPMQYHQRIRNGVRELREISFLEYIDLAVEADRIIAPSLTIYRTAEESKSVSAQWLDVNIAGRKKSKGEMFRLTQLGDTFGAQLANYDQNARKIRINSVSGMRGFKGCPLFIHTGHSSLTTTCRAGAGYGNATVERMLGGARHFSTAEIAKANLVAILTIDDYTRWTPIMEKYNLVYPSVEQVMTMIHRSSDPYWRNDKDIALLTRIVTNMTPLERAMLMYGGDMYSLAICNETMMKQFITKMLILELDVSGDVDTDAVLKTLDSTERAYVISLCNEEMRGTTLDRIKVSNPEGYRKIGHTATALKANLVEYADLINVVFTPPHLPPSVGNIRDISRTTSIIADTDSTIFTTQWWVEWMTGHIKRGYVEDRVWYMATFTVCQAIAHSLALMSANLGVERSMITRLSMKNEYGFPVLMNTNSSKTYAALVSIREGNVYEDYDLDIKGAILRGASAPKVVLDGIASMISRVLHSIDEGKKLVAKDLIQEVAEVELDIIRSVMDGKYTYLRTEEIKAGSNKVWHYEMWQEVWGPKYGMTPPPPIPSVKVSALLDTKSKIKDWLDGIEDRALAKRMEDWLKASGKDKLGTILLPTQIVANVGIPKEIITVANVRTLAFNICKGYYSILEACGLFIVDRDNHKLAYDFLNLEI